MSVPKTIKIDNVEYVPVDSIKSEVVNFTGEDSVASRCIGKQVLVRSRNEGINAGTVVTADATGIELKNCRRLWHHKPKDKNVCWYEGIAKTGLDKTSKVSCTIPSKVIIEDYSATICEREAFISIMEITPHAQNR